MALGLGVDVLGGLGLELGAYMCCSQIDTENRHYICGG